MVESGSNAFRLPDASREVASLRQEAANQRENSRRSARRLLEVEEVLSQSKARSFDLEEALKGQTRLVEELQHRIDRADRVMVAMKASVSWRITAPLRALRRRR
jgi:hypothetical protein